MDNDYGSDDGGDDGFHDNMDDFPMEGVEPMGKNSLN
jgi:hypothetical protein